MVEQNRGSLKKVFYFSEYVAGLPLGLSALAGIDLLTAGHTELAPTVIKADIFLGFMQATLAAAAFFFFIADQNDKAAERAYPFSTPIGDQFRTREQIMIRSGFLFFISFLYSLVGLINYLGLGEIFAKNTNLFISVFGATALPETITQISWALLGGATVTAGGGAMHALTGMRSILAEKSKFQK
ncbi:MAG: hypothetical protein AB7H90_08240 [Alphaproteobacteria bacterium]